MKTPLMITIVLHPRGDFDVVAGELTAYRLIFDEMLGEVVRLTTPGGKPRYMRTADQIVGWMERRKKLRHEKDSTAPQTGDTQ